MVVVVAMVPASTAVKRGELHLEICFEHYLTNLASHNKADCPNPAVAREFTGICRLCEMVGHRAADCPTAPPKVCKNCAEEGQCAIPLPLVTLN